MEGSRWDDREEGKGSSFQQSHLSTNKIQIHFRFIIIQTRIDQLTTLFDFEHCASCNILRSVTL